MKLAIGSGPAFREVSSQLYDNPGTAAKYLRWWKQQGVEKLFPAIAQWVRGYGHIEIGEQEMFGFVARALDYGNLAFEDDRPDTLAEAMAVLEKGLRAYFEREGIEAE